MTKSRQNHANIINKLQDFPLGKSALELAKELNIPPRSILRELKNLVEMKQIVRIGKGPSTLYKAASLLPIGYEKSFLRSYRPNVTSFLNATEKTTLLKLGKISEAIPELETYNAQIYERLIIDLSWASSKLEGNTYSLLETEKLLQENLEASGKDAIETQMILNHKEAIKFITLNKGQLELEAITIKSIHALLSENLLKNPSAGGAIRRIPVGIEGTRYIPMDIPQLIEEEFELLLKKVSAIKNPHEQSLFLLIFIPYLQAFEDLNKRTSRISCNIPLLNSGLTPVSFVNVDTQEYLAALKDIYEYNDTEKMKQLFLKACQYSSEQYRLVKSKLTAPDPLAIKYRDLIKRAVKETVISQKSFTDFNISDIHERKEVASIIEQELASLHEGNLVRFGIRPTEFKKWKLGN